MIEEGYILKFHSLVDFLTDIANAIRKVLGLTEDISATDFSNKIKEIELIPLKPLIEKTIVEASYEHILSTGRYAFCECSLLKDVAFPNCIEIGYGTFIGCSNLTSVCFPECTSINHLAFQSCTGLTSIELPKCQQIGGSAFMGCSNLQVASFPAAINLQQSAFAKCYNLTSLYLLGNQVCSLYNSAVFSSTPIAGYSQSANSYGSIYVPASLVENYKSSGNWSFYADRFVGV